MSVKIDFSKPKKTLASIDKKQKYTYIDIGTQNLLLTTKNNKKFIHDINTSNYDKAAIKASLSNILNSRSGDSILLPEFGIGQLYQLLYSPYDKYTVDKVVKTIKDIIKMWEPRISIISAPAKYSQLTIEVSINYSIPGLETTDTFIYSFKK